MGGATEHFGSQAAAMGSSQAKVYQTDSSDQAVQGASPPGQPASAFATIE